MAQIGIGVNKHNLCVIDLDLRAYFDAVRHDVLMNKVARRINDDDVMRLLKLMLKASGKQGIGQARHRARKAFRKAG